MPDLDIQSEVIEIKIPITLIKINGSDEVLLSFSDKKEYFINESIYGTGKNVEEAEKMFLEMAQFNAKFYLSEHNKLNKLAIFMKGPWSHIGGRWFTILGINVNFRYGKNMKHGFYIPFTKLNINITNAWLIK